MTFEYKVVPAPTRGRKAKGVKTPADRFARALEDVINDLAADGWNYLRTDTLPAVERQGLAGRTTVYQNMLVFRRALETEATVEEIVAPAPTPAPSPAPAIEPTVEPRAPRPVAPAGETAAAPSPSKTLDTMIATELARAPRLPSAGAAQKDPGSPVKAPAVGSGKTDVAAE